MATILAKDFIEKWAEALDVEPTETRRIVIVAEACCALQVYVEKYGTDRMLSIDVPTDGVKVEVL